MNPKTALKKGVESAAKQVPEAKEQVKEKAAKRSMFAKEMQYQVYRIENVLKIKDAKTLRKFVKENSKWYKNATLTNFFKSYEAKKTNEFIEKAKQKTGREREKLLMGIREIVYKAKKEKYAAKKGAEKVRKERDKETEKLKSLIEKDLNEQEIIDIETSMYDPLEFPKDKMDFNKIQQYYLKILTGQKVLAVHAKGMQEKYQGSMKKAQKFQEKYKSGWRKYAGIADWGYRKAKGIWGSIKSVWSDDEKPPSQSDKINSLMKKTAKEYENRMARVKNLKDNLQNRSNEMKIGLGTFKTNLREKLKTLISRGEWTKAKQKEREFLKEKLKQQKQRMEDSLTKARSQGEQIDNAKQGTLNLSRALQKKYAGIESGEKNLNGRIKAVLARVKKLENYYGSDDPRVRHIRENVLLPLMQAREKISTSKENTEVKITNVDKKNQKLDMLKADTYLAATSSVDQISKLDLQISSEGKKIDVLKNKRFELHKLLEEMEFAYAAVDEFKGNVGKNLDKMNKNNDKTVEALNKQLNALNKTKVSPPGLGSSLYNTVLIGKLGFYGAVVELPFKYTPRAIGYAFAKLFGSDAEWDDTKNWTLPGLIEGVTSKYDEWLDKGGIKQHLSEDSSSFTKLIAEIGNFGAGVVGMANGVVRGMNALIFETPRTLDSIGKIITDWQYTKEAGKAVINYHHWEKGDYGIAGGKTAGDILLLVLTAGASAGGQAAAKTAAVAGRTSRLARALAYTKGFVLEGGRKLATAPYRIVKSVKRIGVTGIAKAPFVLTYRGGRYVFDVTRGVVTGKGMTYAYKTRLSRIVGKEGSVIAPAEGSKLARLIDDTDDIAKSAKFEQGKVGKLIENSDMKNLFDKVRESGVKGLSMDELGQLYQGMGKLMYGKRTGLIARTRIEGFRSRLGKYMKTRAKAEGYERYLNRAGGDIDLLKQNPTTLAGVRTLKTRIRERILDIDDEIPKLERRIARLEKDATGKAAKLHWSKKLQRIKKETPLLQAKYRQLSYKAILKNRPVALYNAAKEKAAKLAESFKGKSKAEIAKQLAKTVTAPVWLPYKYGAKLIQRYYRFYTKPDKAGAIKTLKQKGILKEGSDADMLVNYKALSDSSTQINKLVKSGKVREAVELYQTARIHANGAGIPFAAIDRSFMGHLHRVAPPTANYISKVTDLIDPRVINGLPEKLKINSAAWKKESEKHAGLLSKMKQNTKIGKKFINK